MTNLLELRRRRADAKLGGVCAALAGTWSVDPLLVRVGFVVLALLTNGFGVFAYLTLWGLIPEEGSRHEPIRELFPFTQTWTTQRLVATVVAAACVAGLIVTGTGPGALVIAALVLIIVRIGLRGTRTPSPSAPVVPRTEFERLTATWQQRVENVQAGRPTDWSPEPRYEELDPMGLYSPARQTTSGSITAPTRRRYGARTWFAVAVALGVTWTALAVLQTSGVAVSSLAWCSSTLGVLALALVTISRPSRAQHGRPPGLMLLALVTAAVTGVTAIGGSGLVVDSHADSSQLVAYTTGTLPDRIGVGVGSRTVDLREVAVDHDRTMTITVDAGSLSILLPRAGNVVVRYTVEAGSVRVSDTRASGLDLSSSWQRVSDPTQPTLTLDAAVDLGSLEVTP